LDTHDGIGVVDVADLLSPEEIERTLNSLDEKGASTRKIFSGPEYQNLDIYQVNCTYYSALEGNDDSYMAARTIQFFAPGIPQVYYVGLLAGENDFELVERTKNGRDIDQHIQKPVVQRLLDLMTFRSNYPAFDGDFAIEETPDDRIRLTWSKVPFFATADVQLQNYVSQITYYDVQSQSMHTYVV
jgi:sucrose phosphorylase